MVACTECRKSKVKCEQVFPCQRCQRMGKECIPHVSKQGQNPARRKRRKEDQPLEEEVVKHTGCRLQLEADTTALAGGKQSEDALIACQLLNDDQVQVVKGHHFGMQVMVRQWIALAIKRRSFQLLGRASNLAAQCGMDMDDIFCEMGEEHRGMDYLYQFILVPSVDQLLIGPTLLPEVDVPMDVWESMGIKVDSSQDLAAALEHRWIFARETNKGIVRFYTSPGFERNVCSLELIEDTYEKNEMEVSSLFLVKEGNNESDFIRELAQQVALHSRPGLKSMPARHTHVLLKVNKLNASANSQDPNQDTTKDVLADEKETIIVDQVNGYSFRNLECMVYVFEFIPPPNRRGHDVDVNQVVDYTTNMLDGLFFDADNINVEEGDEDFQLIYNILKDS